MKKQDRNCGMTPYPVYGNYPNMMGGTIGPIPGSVIPMPMYNTPINNVTSTQTNSMYDSIQDQINMLDKRITKLESMMNSSTTYNSFSETNYHVM